MPANIDKTFKIVHVMSYHSPWEWADSQFDGFKKALSDLHVDYKVIQLDAKNHSSAEWLEAKGLEARDIIDSWEPDLVYTSDDEAQQYVTKHYINQPLPFVFSAVNADLAAYGIPGSSNVTGVVELEHFIENVKFFKEIVPSVRKIAVVWDDAPIWVPVIERMKAKQTDVPQVEFTNWDKIKTFAEYKSKIEQYQTSVDGIALIGVFNFKDEKGENVGFQEVQQWTAEHSRLPDFSFWKVRATHGTLSTVSISGFEQGFSAGMMARGILTEGRSPASYPIVPTTKGEPIISLARANKLGIKVKSSLLLDSKIVTKFEWER